MRSILPDPVFPTAVRMKLEEMEKLFEGKEQFERWLKEANIAVIDGYVILSVCDTKEEYHQYINDAIPLVPGDDPIEFIRHRAIVVPIGDLTEMWIKWGWVHASLTSLSHDSHNLYVKWSKHVRRGVIKYTTHLRGFNEGILYPNIGLSGLRDFAHIEIVDPSPDVPHSFFWNRFWKLRTYPKPHINISAGLGEYTKSVAESILLAVHTAKVRQLPTEIIAPTILSSLCMVLKEWHCDSKPFEDGWKLLNGDHITIGVQEGIDTDKMSFRRFVGLAERFVLVIENWL